MADEKNLNRWERAAVRPPELWNFEAMPLPPMARPRLLRWLPHVVIVYGIVAHAILGSNDLISHGVGGGYGVLLGTATAAAILCAMRRPLAGWWISLAIAVVTAIALANASLGGQIWPWTVAGIIANAAVLFFLALRVRTRVAVKALLVTVTVGFVLEAFVLGKHAAYSSTSVTAALVYAVVVLIGTSLHGRRVARDQLVEQESLTAEERSRRTLLEERNRIARELHDVVAHHMSVISIQAQVAPHLVQNPSDELKENLEGIRENALEALTELRRVLGVLRSENPKNPEDSEGIPHAPQPTLARLDSLVENVRSAGLSITTDRSGTPHPLSPGVELSAYRIIQEALSNAIRHAPGTHVRVEIAYKKSMLGVRVINTAPTEPAPPSPGAGHGLLGMRERAAMLGGGLAAGRTPDGGYEVTAHLPLQASKDNA
ncbi:sensor histidine kinase [Streptomyces sp. NBC_01142]|uniref:sensor histidine kinase n=1 Tax=Streptomyces sp. NBC_01142 TaxID=2975865 RepID=UPI00224E2E8E|nr:sensor histidine kinase [Streptomyces sp. NBC_01142]MCX4824663.1 sensor histidine kinase [Streptomyces sp. NBC_01142]